MVLRQNTIHSSQRACVPKYLHTAKFIIVYTASAAVVNIPDMCILRFQCSVLHECKIYRQVCMYLPLCMYLCFWRQIIYLCWFNQSLVGIINLRFYFKKKETLLFGIQRGLVYLLVEGRGICHTTPWCNLESNPFNFMKELQERTVSNLRKQNILSCSKYLLMYLVNLKLYLYILRCVCVLRLVKIKARSFEIIALTSPS